MKLLWWNLVEIVPPGWDPQALLAEITFAFVFHWKLYKPENKEQSEEVPGNLYPKDSPTLKSIKYLADGYEAMELS